MQQSQSHDILQAKQCPKDLQAVRLDDFIAGTPTEGGAAVGTRRRL